MLQMKFTPRFIEAFRSGQKITSLRMMDFKCRIYQETEEHQETEESQPAYFHEDTLRYYTSVKNIDHLHLSLSPGTTIEYLSDFAGLLERQSYKQGDEIELVTEIEGGEIMPFTTATIEEILVIKGDQIDDVQAILDGFNPDRDPLKRSPCIHAGRLPGQRPRQRNVLAVHLHQHSDVARVEG